MKKHTKDIIGLIVLIIQIILGSILILFGAFGEKCNTILVLAGAFLLAGSGRKDVTDIFSLFKKN